MGEHGIENLKAAIQAIRDGGIALVTVDWEAALAEVQEIDSKEAADLLIEIGKAAIEILAMLKGSSISGPIFSLLLKKLG